MWNVEILADIDAHLADVEAPDPLNLEISDTCFGHYIQFPLGHAKTRLV